jgi:hypothetical protein
LKQWLNGQIYSRRTITNADESRQSISVFLFQRDRHLVLFLAGKLGLKMRHSATGELPPFAIIGPDEISNMLKEITADLRRLIS